MDDVNEAKYFSEALNLFYETQWLYNAPVTELLTNGSLDAFPKDWLDLLKILKTEELNDFVTKKISKPEWPDTLKTFTENCRLMDRLSVSNASYPIDLPANFKIGLNCKKQHEILHLTHLVHSQCALEGIQVIVDFGAGLGYVCQLLHHLYNYKVLGLERNQKNVNTARIRQKKMYPDSMEHVKYNCCDLTSDSTNTIEIILENEFPESTKVCLIGLHACGDLSVHASKIFFNLKAAHIFIMIPCCYHKLSLLKIEKTQESNLKQYFQHFPLSNCLRAAIEDSTFDVGTFLRQPFLRLACQESADRWYEMSAEAHNEHSFHVLARAVLQLYATKNGFSLEKRVQKGTRKSQCHNFETYLEDSLRRYSFKLKIEGDVEEEDQHRNIQIQKNDIIELWRDNCTKLRTAEIYTGLQLMLQAPAESLVLQDRLCWMREQDLDTIIIPVMDKRLSPRSYAIVARKR